MTSKGVLPLAARGWARIRLAFQTLLPCRFGILVLGVVAFMLAVSDQGQESLRVLAEFREEGQAGAREPYLVRLLLFLAGTGSFAAAAWYFSRQALLLDPPRRPVARESRLLFVWLPRALGFLGFACSSLALWMAGRQYTDHQALDEGYSPRLLLRLLAAILLLLGLAFGWFLAKRRALLKLQPLALPEDRRRVRELAPATRGVLGVSVVLTAILFLWIVVDPIGLTAFVATPTVILFCAAIWIFAGTALVVGASRLRLPLLTVLLAMLLAFSRCSDNHRVHRLQAAPARPTLQKAVADWVSWMDQHYPEEKTHPIFLVAAEGGGLRAAYWTAAVLSAIHTQFPTFSDHCFGISAVSGGSLGAAVFDSLLAARGAVFETLIKQPDGFRRLAGDILSHDFLAPTVARMFGTDLPQQFLPWGFLPDRANAMERAWEHAWATTDSDTFSRPFLDLPGEHGPFLFLNGTEVETGKRVIFSSIDVDVSRFRAGPEVFKNSLDGIGLLEGDLKVSSAVHMSARFTYISPAATIRKKTMRDATVQREIHRIVDGGYFENSGAATAAEILAFLQNDPSVPRDRLVPHVLLIRHSEKPLPGGEALSEELAPIRALFATREARGDQAVAQLKGAGSDYTEFLLQTDQDVPLPLGWLLSAQARRAMDAAIDSAENPAARSRVGSLLTDQRPGETRNTLPDRVSASAARPKLRKETLPALGRLVTAH